MDFKGLEFDGVPIDDDDSSIDDVSQENAILEEEIDYDAIYALYDFVAMVQGQVSAKQGEKLSLLDDSNTYWWLTQVHSTNQIGYIPADNIETPYERLARVNKHKNLMLTQVDPEHLSNPKGNSLKAKKFFEESKSVFFNEDPVSKRFSAFFLESDSAESDENYDSEYSSYYNNSQYNEESEDELSYIDEPGDYEYNSESSDISDEAEHKISENIKYIYSQKPIQLSNNTDQVVTDNSITHNHSLINPDILGDSNNNNPLSDDKKLSVENLFVDLNPNQLKRKSTDSIELFDSQFDKSISPTESIKYNSSTSKVSFVNPDQKNTASLTKLNNSDDSLNYNESNINFYYVPVSFADSTSSKNIKKTILKVAPNDSFSQIINNFLNYFGLQQINPNFCYIESYIPHLDQGAKIDSSWLFEGFLIKLRKQIPQIDFSCTDRKISPDLFILAIHYKDQAKQSISLPTQRKTSKLAGIIHYSDSEDQNDDYLDDKSTKKSVDSYLDNKSTKNSVDDSDDETDGEYTPIEYKSLGIIHNSNNKLIDSDNHYVSTSLFSDKESDLDNSAYNIALSGKSKVLGDKLGDQPDQSLEKRSSISSIMSLNRKSSPIVASPPQTLTSVFETGSSLETQLTSTNSAPETIIDIKNNTTNSKSLDEANNDSMFNNKEDTASNLSSVNELETNSIKSLDSYTLNKNDSSKIFNNIIKGAVTPANPPPPSAYERQRIRSLREGSISSITPLNDQKLALDNQNIKPILDTQNTSSVISDNLINKINSNTDINSPVNHPQPNNSTKKSVVTDYKNDIITSKISDDNTQTDTLDNEKTLKFDNLIVTLSQPEIDLKNHQNVSAPTKGYSSQSNLLKNTFSENNLLNLNQNIPLNKSITQLSDVSSKGSTNLSNNSPDVFLTPSFSPDIDSDFSSILTTESEPSSLIKKNSPEQNSTLSKASVVSSISLDASDQPKTATNFIKSSDTHRINQISELEPANVKGYDPKHNINLKEIKGSGQNQTVDSSLYQNPKSLTDEAELLDKSDKDITNKEYFTIPKTESTKTPSGPETSTLQHKSSLDNNTVDILQSDQLGSEVKKYEHVNNVADDISSISSKDIKAQTSSRDNVVDSNHSSNNHLEKNYIQDTLTSINAHKVTMKNKSDISKPNTDLNLDYLATNPLDTNLLSKPSSLDPLKDNQDLTLLESNIESMSIQNTFVNNITKSPSKISSIPNSAKTQPHVQKPRSSSDQTQMNQIDKSIEYYNLGSAQSTLADLGLNRRVSEARLESSNLLTNSVPNIRKYQPVLNGGSKAKFLNPRAGISSSTSITTHSPLLTPNSTFSTGKNYKLSLARLSRKSLDQSSLSKSNESLLMRKSHNYPLNERSAGSMMRVSTLSLRSPTIANKLGSDTESLVYPQSANDYQYSQSNSYGNKYGSRGIRSKSIQDTPFSLSMDRNKKPTINNRNFSRSFSVNTSNTNIGELELPLDNWLMMIDGWLDYDSVNSVEPRNNINSNSEGSDNTVNGESPYIQIEQEYMHHSSVISLKSNLGLRSSASYQQLLTTTTNKLSDTNIKTLQPHPNDDESGLSSSGPIKTSESISSDERTANEPNLLETIYKESMEIHQKLDSLRSDLTNVARIILNSS
ncbi:hypothetical protein BB561_003405 [Smittium simulii]|uniref:SH3 domain-containing protein n=1 Tax=Smittium simulii TaxID=133385 RepID=A0A2T9YLJ9_9FUNG|nr:hypothetical protein BB561_003405 [Smittium simulii]